MELVNTCMHDKQSYLSTPKMFGSSLCKQLPYGGFDLRGAILRIVDFIYSLAVIFAIIEFVNCVTATYIEKSIVVYTYPGLKFANSWFPRKICTN